MTPHLPGVSARAFNAMQVLNIAELATYPAEEIRPFLPSLTRMALLSPMMENTPAWAESRKQILSILVGVEVVNDIVALLQVNYHDMEMEVKKEQQLRYFYEMVLWNFKFIKDVFPDKRLATHNKTPLNSTACRMALC